MKSSEGSASLGIVVLKQVTLLISLVMASTNPMVVLESDMVTSDWILEEVASIGAQLPGGSPHRANKPSLAIDSQDMPHIAFQNVETKEIGYAFRSESGNWEVETVVDANTKGSFVALILDSSDCPMICYRNHSMTPGPTPGLSCAYKEDSEWKYEIVDDRGYAGTHLSLTVNRSGRAHLAYVVGNGDLIHASQEDEMNWEYSVVREHDDGLVKSMSIGLDSQGIPHIALISGLPEHGMWLYTLNDTEWVESPIDPTNRPGQIFGLSFNSDDHPHLVYGDTYRGVPRYAYNDSFYWSFRTVDTNRSLIGSFVLDSQDNPQVAYEGYDDRDLMYALMEDGLWQKDVVDSEGVVGFRPSLALDSNDVPSITYLDLTDWVLMFATKKKEIQADIDIDPDTLNLRSRGRWITCYIELPAGLDPREIDASTVLLNGAVRPELDPKYGFVKSETSYIMDHDEDGIFERMVKFDRQMAMEALIPGEYVVLTVTGQLNDGTEFKGDDTIGVIAGGTSQVTPLSNAGLTKEMISRPFSRF
jgi:hypothetical protein